MMEERNLTPEKSDVLWCPSCRTVVDEVYVSIDSSARAKKNRETGEWELDNYCEGVETGTVCPDCGMEVMNISAEHDKMEVVADLGDEEEELYRFEVTFGDVIEFIKAEEDLELGDIKNETVLDAKLRAFRQGMEFGLNEYAWGVVREAVLNSDLAKKREVKE